MKKSPLMVWPVGPLLFFVALILMGATGCSPGDTSPAQTDVRLVLEDVEVEVATVERRRLSTETEFTGTLLPKRVTRTTSEVDGVVSEIPQIGTKIDVVIDGKRHRQQLGVTFGQTVGKGDVLVQLDAEDFKISLLMAQAKLRKAQADLAKLMSWQRAEEVRRLTALRDEAKARYEQAERDRQRLKRLRSSNTVSRSEYERAAMEVSTARAVVKSAEATLASAQAGPTPEEIAVQKSLVAQAEVEVQQAQREVGKTTLRAPYDGVITAINVEVGDRVSPSSGAVVELMDLRYLVAEIGVPETYTGAVRVKDHARVQAAGASQAVPGLVIAVNEMVDPQSRTFKVRVAIDNGQRRFKAGQFAKVELSLSAAVGQPLTAPNRSIVFVEGQPYVFVVDRGQVRQRLVEIGLQNRLKTELRNGVNEGDVVVTEDPSLLTDGMKVIVKKNSSTQVASLSASSAPR